MNSLAKARRKVAEVGLLYALQQTKWTFLPDWLIELNVWNVNTVDIRGHALLTEHDPALRWATNRDIAELVECGVNPEALAYSFGKSVKIAVYEHEGRIVGFGHHAVGTSNQSDWLRFRFAPRDCMAVELWIAPEFRGRAIGPKILAFAWSHYAQNGYHRVVNIINVLNHNSTRACAKAGVMATERFLYFRLLGLSYMRYGALRRIGRWTRRNRLHVLLGKHEPLPDIDNVAESEGLVIPFLPRQA